MKSRSESLSSTTIRLTLPRLHQAQLTIKHEARRFNAIRCGRRFGKDVLLQDVLIEPAIRYGASVGWFAPIYKDLAENWRDVLYRLKPIVKSANSTDKRIELITGGVIDMWSLDDKDSGRGRKYKRVVINEASKIRDLQYSWEYVIRQTLMDFKGDAFIGGTPKGFNYFATLCKQDGADWREFHYTTYDNPYIPRDEIDGLKLTLPEMVFRQEVLAEFVEDGTYFQNVGNCAVIDAPDAPNQHDGHTIVMGVDWAKSNDWTVLTVGCRECGKVVDWKRFNQIDYHYQRSLLQELAQRWQVKMIIAESNSIGEPNIEELWRDNLPVQGFTTTAASKAALIESLHLALVKNELKFPKDYADEMRAYEIEIRSGPPKFGAPSGLHDDRVISLALVYRAMTSAQTLLYF